MNMNRYILRVPSFLLGLLLLTGPAFAEDPALIVNIDNPKFRKLVMAVPDFALEEKADADLQAISKEGAEEMSRLLNFCGLFNVMGQAGYAELIPSQSQLAVVGVAPKRGLDGIDIPQWKSIGAESLTLGEITKTGSTYVIALRTADIFRGRLVLGKKYSNVKRNEVKTVVRKYADQLLRESSIALSQSHPDSS